MYSRKRWRRVQYLLNVFWSRWRKEYPQNLQVRQTWCSPSVNIEVGDIVLIKDIDKPRNRWPMARVQETIEGSDKYVRKVKLRLASHIDNKGKRHGPVNVLDRPIHKLIVLVKASEESSHEGP